MSIWSRWFGQAAATSQPSAGAVGEAELRARVATLEMDLRARDQRIHTMQAEYAAAKSDGERAAAGAGRNEVERLFKKLAAPLSNFATLAALAEAGRDVSAADMAALFRDLEKELARFGLEAVGSPNLNTSFEPALHQRMSGGAVRPGTPIVVRVPGYRLGETVVLKAMVTAREEASNE